VAMTLCGLTVGCNAAVGNDAATTNPLEIVQTYTNPLDFPLADPFVVKDGDTYYMYGTTVNAKGHGFDVYVSKNMIDWTRGSKCYTPKDSSWGSHSFWAPEVVNRGNEWFLHFTTYNRKEDRRNICFAKASSPLGPFEDYAGPLFDGVSVIDSHIYQDPKSGQDYIYVTPEKSTPAGILGAKLSADLKTVQTTPTMILTAELGWEDLWIEGTIIHEHKGTLYMMYSGSAYWESEYAIGYATALSPMGPWTKSATNPVLKKNDHVHGPGHNGLAMSPDGKELFMYYHVHADDYTVRRVAALDRIEFVTAESGPDLLVMPGAPSHEARPLPSGVNPMQRAQNDDFNGPDINEAQWHIFAKYPGDYKVENGTLNIAAVDGDFWRTHDSGENLFLQRIPVGDFAIETSVTMPLKRHNEQAFLTLWQDEDNHIMLAAVNLGARRFAVTREVKGKPDTSLSTNEFDDSLCLRLEKVGDKVRFFASADAKEWQKIAEDEELGDLRPQWVGLGAAAPGVDARPVAKFDWFRVEPVAGK